MSSKVYDVAIIGAGPAGSVAAQKTASHGLSTIVIERRSEIGVPVQCGEYIPTPKEIATLLPNSPRASRLLDIPKRIIRNKSSRLHLFSPDFRRYTFNFFSNIIDRAEFDQHLARKAQEAGAEIHLNSTLLMRSENNVLTIKTRGVEDTIRARVVIGADGPQSRIAKSLGVDYENKERDLSPCIQYEMDGIACEQDATEMYFGNSIAPGAYAWIIPKSDERANVGLGYRRLYSGTKTSLSELIQKFLNSHPALSSRVKNANVLRSVGGMVPVGGPVRKTYGKNVILVGDAAGQVLASNGAGVPMAMCAGEIGGMTVVDHLQRGSPLAIYEKRWQREFGSELAASLKILRISDLMMTTDRFAELSMNIARGTFLKHIIRCHLPWYLDMGLSSILKMLEYR